MNNESPILYDWSGRPIKPELMAPPQDGERAYSFDPFWHRHDLHPSRGLTGPRLDQILRQASEQGDVYAQARLFADIEEKDWDTGHAMQTRKLAVQQTPWELLQGDATEEIVKYTSESLKRGGVESMVFSALDAIGKGYAVPQLLWAPGGE